MRKQTDTAFASHLDGAITQKESLVVAPGSFDPITLGHLDVIQRAAKLFDEVIVAVAVNSAKRTLLPLETRVALVQSCVENLPSVSVRGVQGLLAEFCRQVGARAIVKGLRGGQDWGHEEPMALVNKELTGIETVFLPAAPTWGHVSSSLVKDVALHGGDITPYVSPKVREAVEFHLAAQL